MWFLLYGFMDPISCSHCENEIKWLNIRTEFWKSSFSLSRPKKKKKKWKFWTALCCQLYFLLLQQCDEVTSAHPFKKSKLHKNDSSSTSNQILKAIIWKFFHSIWMLDFQALSLCAHISNSLGDPPFPHSRIYLFVASPDFGNYSMQINYALNPILLTTFQLYGSLLPFYN